MRGCLRNSLSRSLLFSHLRLSVNQNQQAPLRALDSIVFVLMDTVRQPKTGTLTKLMAFIERVSTKFGVLALLGAAT